MTTFAVQYLGSRPKEATPKSVREKLHEAFQRLPISMVLLDWGLPPRLEDAVAEETRCQNAELYRWQTWLTGDSQVDLPPEWAVMGLDGRPIPGHENDPDFTFICPNSTAVEEFLAERLEVIAGRGLFQGIFLDRIRFPSPAVDPATHLGCFCHHCTRLAADLTLDLNKVRRSIRSLIMELDGPGKLAGGLMKKGDETGSLLEQFLDFREASVTRVVRSAQRQAGVLGLKVGLDCFSPILARMVGQDLNALGLSSDWVKIMTYPRVFGPAGISFEFFNLCNWLVRCGLTEQQTIDFISSTCSLNLPVSMQGLRQYGLDSSLISREIHVCRELGLNSLLAGIALVDVKGIHESSSEQIRMDLLASQEADGLVLSWDLWQIPLERLDMIKSTWEIP
jgi:hypothetical protein